MKIVKKLIIWSVIAIVIQLPFFIYFDNNVLKPVSSFKDTTSSTKINPNTWKKRVNVDIPQNAKNVSVSYDGNYASFITDGVLKVVDCFTGNTVNVNPENNAEINYYMWHPDDDAIVLVEKGRIGYKASSLNFYTYTASNGQKQELIDFHKQKTSIKNAGNSNVSSMVQFPSSTMYIKVTNSYQQSSIYKINIMNELEKVPIYSSKSIGKIATTMQKDKNQLLYYDNYAGKVKWQEGNTYLKLSYMKKQYLFGVDNNATIYVGEEANNLIDKIAYGTLDTPSDNWKTIPLSHPVSPDNLKINPDGSILELLPDQGEAINVSTGKSVKYSGEFVQYFTDGIAYINNGQLIEAQVK